MSSVKKFLEKYRVAGFFVLTCLISWSGLLIVLGIDGFLGKTPATGAQLPFMFLAMYAGPVVASLLMTLVTGGTAGLRQMFSGLLRWRVNIRWYLIALLAAPVLTLATQLGLSLISPGFFPGAGYLAESFSTGITVTLLIIGMVSGILTGFCEELGWTGFATPGLRSRFGILPAGMIIGLVWGLWHFPLFLERDPAGVVPYVLLIAVRLFTHLPAFRVLMGWVYDRTGSLLIAILMHGSLTACAMLVQPREATQINALVVNLGFTVLSWLVIALVTGTAKKRLPLRVKGLA
ncbi:MAG: CPBP family intramembrane metalloprotease [Spirochaetales bacterium]|nr:CPBP family intramembrane metalloprotease [Spirochaetales bacterium]